MARWISDNCMSGACNSVARGSGISDIGNATRHVEEMITRIVLLFLRPFLERVFWYPRLVSFEAQSSAVVVTREMGGRSCLIQFGPHPNVRPGILFTARVRLRSQRHSGRLQFVQDVVIHRRRTPARVNPNETHECITSRGVRMLDETDPYHEERIAGIGVHTVLTSDSPSNSLSQSEQTDVDDRYRMFLMWIPNRFGGRFRLPISKIEWWWTGTALAEGTNPQCQEGQAGWKLSTPPSSHGNDSTGRPSLKRPTTSPNVRTVKKASWTKC